MNLILLLQSMVNGDVNYISALMANLTLVCLPYFILHVRLQILMQNTCMSNKVGTLFENFLFRSISN